MAAGPEVTDTMVKAIAKLMMAKEAEETMESIKVGDREVRGPKKKSVPPKVERADIPRIIVPLGLAYNDAAYWCAKKAAEEDAIVPFSRVFHCLPWAGAWATERVLEREKSATAEKASEMLVPGKGGKQHKVRWGIWDIAGLGKLHQAIAFGRDSIDYTVTIQCPRRLGPMAEELHDMIGAEIDKRELYAGCAIMLEPNEKGQLYLEKPPTVVNLEPVSVEDLILSRAQETAVKAEIFMPITETARVEAAGVSVRRGALFTGRPGTGKTMCARIAARLALDEGWTAFYLPDARAVEAALRVAFAHQPAILICEDLDRQLSGERDAHTDRILNALDGLDRRAKVIFIGTTNDPDDLPAPLLRPGRLDTMIFFDLPDAYAAGRLLNQYLGARAIQDQEELSIAADACKGLLPAAIREVSSRSVLHALLHNRDRDRITAQDVVAAAAAVREQQNRLEEAENPKERMEEYRVHVVEGQPRGAGAIATEHVAGASLRQDGAATSVQG